MTSPDHSSLAEQKLSKGQEWALFLVAILPIAVIVRLISEYAVNVPYGDEWSLLPLFAKWHDHQLTFADLFRQHNEHRIFFPKLIYLTCARWTHWNVRSEMFFSVLLCCVTSAGIYFLIQRTIAATPRKRLLLWALINLLIFAPVQAENWLWGFQLQVFLPTLCLVGSLALLSSALPELAKVLGASLLAVVATFSFGGGLLLWPAIAFYLLCKGEGLSWLICWIAAFVLITFIYFTGYTGHPIPGPQFGNPLDYFAYFVEFIGIALSRSSLTTGAAITAGTIGAMAFLLYLIGWWLFLKSPREMRVAAAPWLALGAYAILSAALSAYMRVSNGPQQALNSRYASISLNLYIALVGLVAVAAQSLRARQGPARFAKLVVSGEAPFFTAVVTLSALSFPAAIDHMEILHSVRLEGLARLQFCKIIGPSEKLRNALLIGTPLPMIMQDVDLADRLQLVNPTIRHSAALLDAEDRPQRSTPEFGRCESLIPKEAALEVRGWSFLPRRGRPGPCAVLAYESAGNWVAFALSDIRESRADIVKEMKSRRYSDSGWRRVIHRNELPEGAARISAWALDPAAGEVYKLPGDFIAP